MSSQCFEKKTAGLLAHREQDATLRSRMCGQLPRCTRQPEASWQPSSGWSSKRHEMWSNSCAFSAQLTRRNKEMHLVLCWSTGVVC